jgi:hypothetical protein
MTNYARDFGTVAIWFGVPVCWPQRRKSGTSSALEDIGACLALFARHSDLQNALAEFLLYGIDRLENLLIV